MIDVHSHILPELDDGAQNLELAISMLKESALHGVTDVVSTSHCYPKTETDIKKFLHKRKSSYDTLCSGIDSVDTSLPNIHLGCEVNMLTDISDYDSISALCIENTEYILVEMPYSPWSEWMIDSIYKLTLRGLKPIMAHIDRYTSQNKENLMALLELDVIFQVNADLFLNKKMKKTADKLINDGYVHIIGSDMHSMGIRKPNLQNAKEEIVSRYGLEFFNQMQENARYILKNEDIPHRSLAINKQHRTILNFLRNK